MRLLLVVVSLLNSFLIGTGNQCGNIILSKRPYTNCTSANKLTVVNYQGRSLKTLNSLRTVAQKPKKTDKNFVYVRIEHNPNLEFENGSFLPNLTRITTRKDTESVVVLIRNNSHLCLPEEEKERLERLAIGWSNIQKCNCFTNGTMENGASVIYGGEDCRQINGDFIMRKGVQISPRIEKLLQNVEIIRGRLVAVNTTLEDLSFLKNLAAIEADSPLAALHIEHSHKMIRLHLRSLDTISNKGEGPLVHVVKNELLRLTNQEKIIFFKNQLKIDAPREKGPIAIRSAKCPIENDFPTNLTNYEFCETLIGDLVIDETIDSLNRTDIYDFFPKMREIEGCLTVRNTKLENLDFFAATAYITCKKNRPPIIIENNQNLKNIALQIYDVRGLPGQPAILLENNPLLCRRHAEYLKNLLNGPLKKEGRIREVVFDGGDECFDILKEHPDLQWIFYLVASAVLVLLLSLMEIISWRRRKMKELNEMKR